MWFRALATDYDGTLARQGRVDDATAAALQRLKASGRRLVVVTGRSLEGLTEAFPHARLCDRIVAENGAVLYRPQSGERVLLGAPVDAALVAELRALHVERLAGGGTRHHRHAGAQPGPGAGRRAASGAGPAGQSQQGRRHAAADGGAARPVGWRRRCWSWRCRRATPWASAMPRTTWPSCSTAVCRRRWQGAVPALREHVDVVLHEDNGAGVRQARRGPAAGRPRTQQVRGAARAARQVRAPLKARPRRRRRLSPPRPAGRRAPRCGWRWRGRSCPGW